MSSSNASATTENKMSELKHALEELTVSMASLKPGQTWKGLIYPKYADAAMQHFQSLGYGVKENGERTEQGFSWVLITKRKCQF